MKTTDQIPVLLKQGPTDNWLVNYRSKIILHMKPIASKKRDLHLQCFLGHFIS